MKVYERLADAFIAEGTTHVFGMMGDGNMYWMNALLDEGVECVEVRHEGVGMGMADGWARHTHTPGVATATCGPGVTQLATACVVAARAESPVVAFVGERPRKTRTTTRPQPVALRRRRRDRASSASTTGEFADEAVRSAFYKAKLERARSC
jgi:thiamine pyrophosphate-dependent acetolactate synthase large subunit-like protein